MGLLGLLWVGTTAGITCVIVSLMHWRPSGTQLLASAAVVLFTNVVTFSLVFWELDSGGPVKRALAESRKQPDFQFPQDENPQLAAPNWRPALFDFLYVSVTNSIAFSPTDAMPLTRQREALHGARGRCLCGDGPHRRGARDQHPRELAPRVARGATRAGAPTTSRRSRRPSCRRARAGARPRGRRPRTCRSRSSRRASATRPTASCRDGSRLRAPPRSPRAPSRAVVKKRTTSASRAAATRRAPAGKGESSSSTCPGSPMTANVPPSTIPSFRGSGVPEYPWLRGAPTRPSVSVHHGLCATSHGCPSGSTKTPE